MAWRIIAVLVLTAGFHQMAAAADAIPAAASPAGGQTTRPVAGRQSFSLPAANIRAEHKRIFFFGNRIFNTNWTIAPATAKNFDGLGPTFNRVSCSGCHLFDGRGRPPLPGENRNLSMLVRLGVYAPSGEVVAHPQLGGQLQENAILGVLPEVRVSVRYTVIRGHFANGDRFELRKPVLSFYEAVYPLGDFLHSARVAPAIAGVGLLEAVAAEDIIARADENDDDGDGISGRAAFLDDAAQRLGRFGWKAAATSLREQNARAALHDIGLTNPLLPEENCPSAQTACAQAPRGDALDLSAVFLKKLTDYTRLLAVPARRGAQRPEVLRGGKTFAAIGCSACHTPTMRAAATENILPELRGQVFHPYTDLLLHDMGEGLADNLPEGAATAGEWRTAPLWGLGLVPVVNNHSFYLHDGRARNLQEAILWHGGEARLSRDGYKKLSAAQRAELLAFIGSL